MCNARAVAGALPAFGVPSDKIIVIPNPPVTAPLPQDGAKRDSVRQRHGASGSDRVLLCVAGFRPGKGQDALIRTLARTPESSRLVLWLVGDGDTRAACEALAKNIGVAGRVRFLGHAADPRELYLAAEDLAVMASAVEALPNLLIEAQLHGVPGGDVGHRRREGDCPSGFLRSAHAARRRGRARRGLDGAHR